MTHQPAISEHPLGALLAPAQEYANLVHTIAPAAKVYAGLQGSVLDLWIVLPAYDLQSELELAGAAFELMGRYPYPQVEFDWMVVEQDSPALEGLEQNGYCLVPTD